MKDITRLMRGLSVAYDDAAATDGPPIMRKSLVLGVRMAALEIARGVGHEGGSEILSWLKDHPLLKGDAQ